MGLKLILEMNDGVCVLPGLTLDLRWTDDGTSLLEARLSDKCWYMSLLRMSMSLSLDDGAPEKRKVRYICLSVCLLQMTSLACRPYTGARSGAESTEQRNQTLSCNRHCRQLPYLSTYMYTYLLEEVLVCFTSGRHLVMLRGKVPCSRGLRKGNFT